MTESVIDLANKVWAFVNKAGEKLDEGCAELDFFVGVFCGGDTANANDVITVFVHAVIEFFDAGVHLFFNGFACNGPRHGLPCLGCCFERDGFAGRKVEDEA